jgi:N-methylhydantoinase B/oxoprolinase/acetone carboxylase alpha subunit
MNNVTWGDDRATSYYETVAGGAGAVGFFSARQDNETDEQIDIDE